MNVSGIPYLDLRYTPKNGKDKKDNDCDEDFGAILADEMENVRKKSSDIRRFASSDSRNVSF